MRTNEDWAVSHLLRSRHNPRLTGGSLHRFKGGEARNAQRPVAQTRAAQRLDIDNTPPRLRRVTYQLALLPSA